MDVRVFSNGTAVGRAAAQEIATLIQAPRPNDRPCVLGLAAGATPIAVYRELVRLHHLGLSFANVATFNLDEFYPMPRSSPRSYSRFMADNFLDHVDISPANVHAFDGSIDRDQVAAHCERYEHAIVAAGGVDLQLLGIGRNGHIGFNEPGSSRVSRTRLVSLDATTRRDAKPYFGKGDVPYQGITMGVGCILRARRIVLLAVGSHKGTIVTDAAEGPVIAEVPASFLQGHFHASMYVDSAAASGLSRLGRRE